MSSWPVTWPPWKRIYELADQPFTDTSRSAMEAFAAQHPRGRHGTVTYQPEVCGNRPCRAV